MKMNIVDILRIGTVAVSISSCAQVDDSSYLTAHLPQGNVKILVEHREGRDYTKRDVIELKDGHSYGFNSYVPAEDLQKLKYPPITISRVANRIVVEKKDEGYRFNLVTPGTYEVRCDPSALQYPKISILRYTAPTAQERVNLSLSGKTYRRDTQTF